MSKLKIVIMPSNPGAIGALRMVEPLQEMEKQGLVEIKGIFESCNGNNFSKAIIASKDADILWFQAILSQPFIMAILNARQQNPKLKLVMDIDDNIFAINPWNPVYGTFSMENPVIDNKEIALPLARNIMNNRLLETCLMESDAVIPTTRLLANIYYKYNKNLYPMNNTLLLKNWNLPHVHRRGGNRVRLGWQGGNTHSQDWLMTHAAIRDILVSRKDVEMEWITAPYGMEGFIKDFPKDQFNIYMFKHYDSHSWRHNCLRPDIGLVPLHEDEFSICKTDLKAAEYAAMGIPVVASNLEPYKSGVIHGKTGFLANDNAEWFKYVNLLVNDRNLRKKMGKAAFEHARERWCLEKAATEWHKVLCDIMEVNKQWQIPKEV